MEKNSIENELFERFVQFCNNSIRRQREHHNGVIEKSGDYYVRAFCKKYGIVHYRNKERLWKVWKIYKEENKGGF